MPQQGKLRSQRSKPQLWGSTTWFELPVMGKQECFLILHLCGARRVILQASQDSHWGVTHRWVVIEGAYRRQRDRVMGRG